MKIDKHYILNQLYNNNVMKNAHNDMIELLIGGMKKEYLGECPPGTASTIIQIPYIRTVIQMFVNIFFANFAESIIHQIAQIVSDNKSCPLYIDYKKSCQALKDRAEELNK
jgi:hypothetical protein